MKTSHGNLCSAVVLAAGGALLLVTGCASSTSPTIARNGNGRYYHRASPRTVTDTWATETPNPDVYVRQDAYGNNTPPNAANRKRFVTGSLVPQEVNVNGNSADTAEPVRVYGQGDLRRHGGGFDAASSLSNIDPAITVGGR